MGVKGNQAWCEIDLERCVGCEVCVHIPQKKSNPYELTVCPWDAIEMVPTEQVAQVVAQIGGPPEYIRENWDRLGRDSSASCGICVPGPERKIGLLLRHSSQPASGSSSQGLVHSPQRSRYAAYRVGLIGAIFQPLFRFRNQLDFFVERYHAGHDLAAQEDEVGVEHIAATVLIDLVDPTFVVHVLNHVPLDFHLSGFAEHHRGQIQSAVEAGRTEVGQQVLQIEV